MYRMSNILITFVLLMICFVLITTKNINANENRDFPLQSKSLTPIGVGFFISKMEQLELNFKTKNNRIEYLKQYYKDNKEKIQQYRKQYYKDNKKTINEYSNKYHKQYYVDNKENFKQYNKDNKEKINNNRKNRYKIDIKYKLNSRMSTAICFSLKGNKKNRHWGTLVNYTLVQLKRHLEKQFDENMNWDNYGSYWNIEHLIPKSKFNFTLPEHIDFKRCWNLKNLRPLEKIANFQKSDKLLKPFQPTLAI